MRYLVPRGPTTSTTPQVQVIPASVRKGRKLRVVGLGGLIEGWITHGGNSAIG